MLSNSLSDLANKYTGQEFDQDFISKAKESIKSMFTQYSQDDKLYDFMMSLHTATFLATLKAEYGKDLKTDWTTISKQSDFEGLNNKITVAQFRDMVLCRDFTKQTQLINDIRQKAENFKNTPSHENFMKIFALAAGDIALSYSSAGTPLDAAQGQHKAEALSAITVAVNNKKASQKQQLENFCADDMTEEKINNYATEITLQEYLTARIQVENRSFKEFPKHYAPVGRVQENILQQCPKALMQSIYQLQAIARMLKDYSGIVEQHGNSHMCSALKDSATLSKGDVAGNKMLSRPFILSTTSNDPLTIYLQLLQQAADFLYVPAYHEDIFKLNNSSSEIKTLLNDMFLCSLKEWINKEHKEGSKFQAFVEPCKQIQGDNKKGLDEVIKEANKMLKEMAESLPERQGPKQDEKEQNINELILKTVEATEEYIKSNPYKPPQNLDEIAVAGGEKKPALV